MFTFLMIMFLMACPVVIPIVVYKKATKFHTATLEVNVKANDVYRAALLIIEEDPELKLLKKDDEKFLAEAEKGELNATIMATQLDDKKTQLIVTADAGKKETDKELALQIITNICDKLGIKYTVVDK
jgi:hypothetical protein